MGPGLPQGLVPLHAVSCSLVFNMHIRTCTVAHVHVLIVQVGDCPQSLIDGLFSQDQLVKLECIRSDPQFAVYPCCVGYLYAHTF